jgi:hypothetical protein
VYPDIRADISSTAGRMRFAAAVLDVAADRGDERNLRLHVPREFALHLRGGRRESGSNICARAAADDFCAVGFNPR